jgi:hypothetical protein
MKWSDYTGRRFPPAGLGLDAKGRHAPKLKKKSYRRRGRDNDDVSRDLPPLAKLDLFD